MQYANLLCAHAEISSVREFAKIFFDAVGIGDGQERESSNYPEGIYFKGSLNGIEFTVSLSDEDGNEDLPFWVQAATSVDVGSAFEDIVNRIVRERLLAVGFRAAQIFSFGKRDEQRIDYE